MTRAEYEATYGVPPPASAQPRVRMTRAEYEATYGAAPQASAQPAAPKKDILQQAEDVVTTVFPGKQIGKAIGTLGGLAFEKVKGLFGGKDNSAYYDTSAPSVAQVAGDAAAAGLAVAGAKLPIPATIPGKMAQFGALGAAGGGANAVAEGKDATAVAQDAAMGGAVGAGVGGLFGVAEKGFRALGRFFGHTGDKIQMSVIKPSQADIRDGFSIETVNKYGLGGSLKQSFAKTDATLDDLSKQLSAKIGGSNATVDLNTIYKKTAERILTDKAQNFGANRSMETALEGLRGEITAVAGETGVAPLQQAQTVKRAAGHFGAWLFGHMDADATARQKVYSTFYNEIKKAIEQNAPEGVREINKQISELIPVMNALIRRIPVAERNSAISLTDVISLSAGLIEPRAFSLSLLNLASKSGAVGTALSKTGSSMENATFPALGRLLQTGTPMSQ